MLAMDFLKWVWKKWLAVAQVIGNFQAQVILTFFYLVILGPLGITFSFLADPFGMRKKLKTNFQKWEHPKQNLEEARKQY